MALILMSLGESLLGHALTIFGPLLVSLWVTLGPFLGAVRALFGYVWGHSGTIPGSLLEHSPSIFGAGLGLSWSRLVQPGPSQ